MEESEDEADIGKTVWRVEHFIMGNYLAAV